MSGALLQAVRSLVGGLPRTYWVLWTGTLINRLGGFVVPFLALYLTRQRGFTVEQAGLVASLHGAGTVLAGPLGGTLADRLGRRITLAGGLWLGAGGMLFLGFSREPFWIAVAAFTLGTVGELYRPAVSAAIADVVPPADRTRAFSLLYWVINVGFAAALPIAGLMTRYGYLLLFIADAITTFLYGCAIWVLLPETRPTRPEGEAAPARSSSAVGSVLAPFKDPVFIAFGVPVFAVALIFFQGHMALPLDLSQRGLTEAQFGMVLAVNGVLIVLLQPFIGGTVARLKRSTALALAAVLTGVGFGLHALSASMGLAMLAVVVWTLGEIAQAPVAPTVVADLAPTELRGTYQGAYNMLWGLAACAAPALGGQMLGRFGATALWLVCLAVGVVAAVWHLAIAGARRRRLESLRALRPGISASAD
ncbi:MDR family MFS transporter [Pyxidicoccus xibeiensis]|uniref:MDR family MFS transporter n=1 Tax=Pyxidicoccus xibeiensis TaxID=2906759 RepID=UPI0020A7308F|nr:MFS transporter [Pyxidicoccus xibeiensis]MCP3136026.1 MFS transporter [Pyxidicoccus xibeiensis]